MPSRTVLWGGRAGDRQAGSPWDRLLATARRFNLRLTSSEAERVAETQRMAESVAIQFGEAFAAVQRALRA